MLEGAQRAAGGPFPLEAVARHHHAQLQRERGAQAPEADVVIANALILTDPMRHLGLLQGFYGGTEVGTAGDAERLTDNGRRFLRLLDDADFVAHLERQPLRGDRNPLEEALRRFDPATG